VIVLTPRQRQVAEMVAKGLSNKAIARELGVSLDTVKAHIHAAAERVPFHCRARHALTLFVLSTRGPESV
jgi:DNA-binding NarL/FixJ family response regulator